MIIALSILGYLVMVALNFWLLITAYRFDLDVKIGDAVFFVFLSLIPIAFIPAGIICLSSWLDFKNTTRKVLFKKF